MNNNNKYLENVKKKSYKGKYITIKRNNAYY